MRGGAVRREKLGPQARARREARIFRDAGERTAHAHWANRGAVLGALAHLGPVIGPEIAVGWRRSVGLKSLTGKTNKRTNFKRAR